MLQLPQLPQQPTARPFLSAVARPSGFRPVFSSEFRHSTSEKGPTVLGKCFGREAQLSAIAQWAISDGSTSSVTAAVVSYGLLILSRQYRFYLTDTELAAVCLYMSSSAQPVLDQHCAQQNERKRERKGSSNSSSKTLILKGSSVRSSKSFLYYKHK